MKRKLFAILAAALLLSGCSLAQEPTTPPTAVSDTLVGVLVTTEYLDLFDGEGWLNDNIDKLVLGGETVLDGNTSQYQGRIYAVPTEEGYYEFPEDLQGSMFLCYTVTPPDGDPFTNSVVTGCFSDCHTAVSVTDAGEAIRLTGTIYFDPRTVQRETVMDAETELPIEHICFYSNPIYQTPEGDIYVTSGMGSSYSADHDVSSGYFNSKTSLSSKVSTTVNGETMELENMVEVTYEGVKIAEELIVIEMSADNRQLRAVGYTPEQFPRELTVGSDTAYVIVETHNGSEVNRQICTAGAEDDSFEVFLPADNGFARKQTTKVLFG